MLYFINMGKAHCSSKTVTYKFDVILIVYRR